MLRGSVGAPNTTSKQQSGKNVAQMAHDASDSECRKSLRLGARARRRRMFRHTESVVSDATLRAQCCKLREVAPCQACPWRCAVATEFSPATKLKITARVRSMVKQYRSPMTAIDAKPYVQIQRPRKSNSHPAGECGRT